MTNPSIGFGGVLGFRNPPVGSNGALVLPSIHSPNFIPGVSGWSINKDGTAQFNEITLIVSTSQAAILIYAGQAGPGTLIGSWSGQPGVDQYGNVFPGGIMATQGTFTSISLSAGAIISSVINDCLLTNAQIQSAQMTGGTITETVINFDSSGGGLLMYATTTTTVSQTVSGTYTFTAPANVTQADVSCWGADAAGDGGSSTQGGPGGGAGGFSREPAYPLVPGQVYTYIVGDGSPGVSTGATAGDGGDSSFDNGGVLGNGGSAATGGTAGGLGGAATLATYSFKGGDGGSATGTGAGGGGGRAGSTGAGGNGTNNTGSGSAAGGAAGTGTGGHAGGSGGSNGNNGSTGGAGGGAGSGSTVNQKTKTYTCNGTHSYQGSDGGNPNLKINDNGTSYQGGNQANTYNGKSKTWIHFNSSAIQSDFAGYSMSQSVVILNNNHTWYNSGMTVALGYTSRSTFPSTLGDPSGANIDFKEWAISQGQTTTKDCGSALATAFANGSADCLVLFKNSNSLTYYGYFAGLNQSGPPQLKLTGSKGTGANTSGSGVDGRVDIIYTSGTTLLGSIAPVAGTDQYGNSYPKGFASWFGQLDATMTDLTNRTVTSSSQTQLGPVFTIPANDGVVGTTYEYEAWGNGTWGSTQQQANFQLSINGAGTGSQGAANTTFPASAAFNWRARFKIYVTTAGGSGNVDFSMEVPLGPNSAGGSGGTTIMRTVTTNAWNTGAAQTVGLNFNWASTTGGPTITCRGATLTRKGPA